MKNFFNIATMVVILTAIALSFILPGQKYRKYDAVDFNGKQLSISEYRNTYKQHQHNVGDTVTIHTDPFTFGTISSIRLREGYDFKNVIITKLR